ncbi:hypothetical protein Pcinc_007238 [Petrolisthes cinctipes]|uniref:Uncharacterized protein n=1 Tax=Petrolisthes cinctipes TaxID=88211 RepID=A0AAE1G9S5_PETCI|nr:hypothetical protein Pcinc_007238 [Petrolisthes cinctipes]
MKKEEITRREKEEVKQEEWKGGRKTRIEEKKEITEGKREKKRKKKNKKKGREEERQELRKKRNYRRKERGEENEERICGWKDWDEEEERIVERKEGKYSQKEYMEEVCDKNENKEVNSILYRSFPGEENQN